MEKLTTAQAEGDSPSMTLLVRLQQLRQWQEKQRENLKKSNSFQNSTSVNSSYESCISESPSNIPTSSVLHSVVSHSINTEPSLTNEETTPSHLCHSLSYSSDSNNATKLSCASLKSSNLNPIPTLDFGQNEPVSNVSNSKHLQSSSQVSSNTQLKDSEFHPIDQYKKQEIKEMEEKLIDSETRVVKKEDKGTECASENYDSTIYLSVYSSDLNKKVSSLPVKPSSNIKKFISSSVSSVDDNFKSNPISLKTNDLEAPYVDADTNSPKSIFKSRETGYISTRYQDSGNDQNEISENQNKQSIIDGCKEKDTERNKSYKNYDNFDDIPIRTRSQNFQDILSKNLEGNKFNNKKQSPSVPKFSFMKKGVGSAATQIIDIDSGFGSSSSISGNATKVESSTENKIKIKKKFLRKGQGTSRFGMQPSRLKKLNLDTSSFKYVPKELEYDNLKDINKDRLVLENIRTQYPRNGSNFDDGKTRGIKQATNFQVKEVPSNQYTNTNIQISNKSQGVNISRKVNKTEKREVEELSAFEQLEELADESSFCSNSSTVIHLLQKGLRSASSTPIRSPAPFDFGESPIPVNNQNSSESRHNQELLSLSQVLEHCAALVQLEKEGNSNITQKDIDYLVESIMSDQTVSLNSVSEYLQNLQQRTINVGHSNNNSVHLNDDQKPRVHFRQQGVDVHEYDVLDSESDTTLTDVQSIDGDTTDLVSTSDLEALAHLNLHGMLEHVPDRYDMLEHIPEEVLDKSCVNTNRNMNLNNYLFEIEGRQKNFLMNSKKKGDSVQKVLEFSPPRHPPNSASHLVWSIFGQEKLNTKSHQSKTSNLNVVPNNEKECIRVSPKSLNGDLDSCQKDLNKEQDSDKLEIDSHKTLLMAKICELEKETKTFQKKNGELQILQDSLKLDQENLSREKEDFKKQMTEHENKLREAINRERNRLWKERQDLKLLNKEQMTLEAARNQSLEIVMLKEKLSDVEEEVKKKDSSHQFSVRKLTDKIKSLEQENKKLKVDLCTLQILEKENLNLKHKLDRGKLDSKTVLSDKAINKTQNLKKKVTIANAIKKSVEIRQKPKSINDVNKELDKELITSEEIDVSIKDVYPSRNLTTKDIEKATVNMTSKNKLAIKEVKDLTYFRRGHHNNKLESKPEKSLPVMEEADKSSEDASSLPSPTTLINHGSPSIKLTEHDVFVENKGMPSDIFRDMQQDIHSPGSVNMDYTENCRTDGTKEIIYANGNKKEIFPNGVTVMNYYNGDCKEQHKDKTVYIYGTDQTKHITFTDGKEIVEFPNGQKETTYPDGSSEITFPDMSIKKISDDGTEICLMKDGTVVRTNPDGSKVFEFPSGQREVHMGDEKRREYPDGTIKILYDDGRVETRYKNGRIRIRDKQGNIITDTHG